MIGHKTNEYSLELVMQVRDWLGRPTGKTKSIQSDSGYDLWKLWQECHVSKQNKKKGPLPNAKEAQQLLTSAGEYADKVRQNHEKG